jgi:glycerol-3-phosphate dehydrogenase
MPAPGTTYDVFVVGGGINGCGIARDAAGRGYTVFLAEMDDLGSGTSSLSTKLVHGGLRYLEHYEFRLVREALAERARLWRLAPHIVRPMRFVLPHHAGLRPAWLLRLGLFLYDQLGGRGTLPGTRTLDLRSDPAGAPLKPRFSRAFEYSDCWVDDARLVVLNARDAADRGATIATRCQVVGAHHDGGCWQVAVSDRATGAVRDIAARLMVNAAGPWVDTVLGAISGRNDIRNVRLVQGSHIVVPRLFDHARSYILQNADGRVIFLIPYEQDFTLIGTTDRDYAGDPSAAATSDQEIRYLCGAASEYLSEPVRPDQVVHTYSGVRPLFDDGTSKAQEATRDYVLQAQGMVDSGLVLNIFGGKITTYRRLAEAMLEHIEAALGRRGDAWTGDAALPGGDFPVHGFEGLVAALLGEKPFLGERLAGRLVRQYGTVAWNVVGSARALDDLGEQFGADLHACEVEHLMTREWARAAEDVLWRRTKLGLRFAREDVASLERYMQAHAGDHAGRV